MVTRVGIAIVRYDFFWVQICRETQQFGRFPGPFSHRTLRLKNLVHTDTSYRPG